MAELDHIMAQTKDAPLSADPLALGFVDVEGNKLIACRGYLFQLGQTKVTKSRMEQDTEVTLQPTALVHFPAD
eukprot:6280704-Amphidinium_carterae.1